MSEFQILTVCSGNICRSPLAEQLLRVGLSTWSDVTLASAGTIGLAGQPMPDQAATLSRRLGGDPTTHAARVLAPDHLMSANLVLAMSREHRRAIAELVPRAIRYTFTIREFARLTANITDSDLEDAAALPAADITARFQTLVPLAASQRGAVPPPAFAEDDDVVDPYRRSDDIYAESAHQLVPAVEQVVSLFSRAASIGQR